MKKVIRILKTILKGVGIFVLILIGLFLLAFPPPWKSWSINDPTKEQVQDLTIYFMTDRAVNGAYWCGNLKYTNDADCEFRLLVTNPKADTLYNRVIKAPEISPYEKDLEFSIFHSRDISIHYIPINVPKNTKIKFYFKNYFSCVD